MAALLIFFLFLSPFGFPSAEALDLNNVLGVDLGLGALFDPAAWLPQRLDPRFWDVAPAPRFPPARRGARTDKKEQNLDQEGNQDQQQKRQVKRQTVPLSLPAFESFLDNEFFGGDGAGVKQKEQIEAIAVAAAQEISATPGTFNSAVKYYGTKRADLGASTLFQVHSLLRAPFSFFPSLFYWSPQS
jgi:hypothetical protein